ncbi:hypothetical protein GCM10029992_40940 [Glycomyces albus]
MIHIGRGSKGAMFFQWRSGRGGAEQWHSALVPHAGKNTRMFREVVDFGKALPGLAEGAEEPVETDVAILWSPDSWWATDGHASLPAPVDYLENIAQIHRVLRDRGVVADFVRPEGDLSNYRTVIAPSTYVLSRAAAENLRWFTAGGGRLVASYLTGAVDEHCQIWLDGFLGGLTDLFGIRVTEHLPSRPGRPGRCGTSGPPSGSANWWSCAARSASPSTPPARSSRTSRRSRSTPSARARPGTSPASSSTRRGTGCSSHWS